jgi:hypothetical protein
MRVNNSLLVNYGGSKFAAQVFPIDDDAMLPELAAYWDSSYIEFLDKEIFTDIAGGERHEVDLLIKTRFRGRGDIVFLIHLENQRCRPRFRNSSIA